MPEYTLRIRRYDPDSGDGAHWDEHTVDMPETQSVLDAILKVKDETDGSIGIRCSCQQAICGSCGVRKNAKPGPARQTHPQDAGSPGLWQGRYTFVDGHWNIEMNSVPIGD